MLLFCRHRAASIALICCTGAWAQSVPTPTEVTTIEQYFQTGRFNKQSLYSAPMRADGSRGLTILSNSEASDDDSLIASSTYCHADAVVIGSFVSSAGFLSRDRSMTFTRSLFSTQRTIKDGSIDAPVPTLFDVTWPGGVARDEVGQVLSVTFPFSMPFESGKTYLLFLKRSQDMHDEHYLPAGAPVLIVNERIYPVYGGVWRKPSGTPLDDLLALMRSEPPYGPCRP